MASPSGRGPVRGGHHVHGRELGEHLGVEPVAVAGAFGDHAELLGRGQHHPLRVRLDEPHEPFVAGGRLDHGLDHGLELPEFREEPHDPRLVAAGQAASVEDLAGRVDDADRDTLLVQAAAGRLQRRASFCGNGNSTLQVYHASKHTPSRLDLPLS
jgi:hypothetical protein